MGLSTYKSGLLLSVILLMLSVNQAKAQKAELEKYLTQPGLSSVTWSRVQYVQNNDVEFEYAAFTASGAAASVAQQFSSVFNTFKQVLTLPGRIVLSGLESDRHWLANIVQSGTMSQGMVSLMHLPSTVQNLQKKPQPVWLPHGAIVIFNQTTKSATEHIEHFAYQLLDSSAEALQHFSRVLPGLGWSLITEKTSFSQEWQKERQRFRIHSLDQPYSSFLFVQHIRREEAL